VSGWGDDLAEWWVGEVATDIGYAGEVLPMALDLLDPQPGESILELGCGEGRVMRRITDRGAVPIGCDLSHQLLTTAREAGAVVQGRLPSLAWCRDDAVDAVIVVLVLEHLADPAAVFAEAARVTRPGGRLAVVVNHPVLTSPGSAPIIDPDDDEVLWRWGDYFGSGHTTEPAGGGSIEFHHRSIADLLTTAASAGWSLERLVEAPVGEQRRGADPLLAAQADIPRLLGARWAHP
jgi:SAM-dependent methyltransferase